VPSIPGNGPVSEEMACPRGNGPVPVEIPKDHVKILLRELPKENWEIRGGQAGCDIELGFKVEI
jgi:hypothetical protein